MATLSKLCSGLWDLLMYERHILVTVQVHAHGRTVVRIDVSDPYRMKATSILCLLGFGLGFSGVLLYRLYNRYYKQYTVANDLNAVSDDVSTPCRKRHRHKFANSDSLCNTGSLLTTDSSQPDDPDDVIDDCSSAPSGDSGNLTDLSPVSHVDDMGNQASRDDPANTVHYDHYGSRVGFASYPWDAEGTPWRHSPDQPGPTASTSVTIPRPRPDDFTPGSADTYLEFLHNRFGPIPPEVANSIANGEIDVERFLKTHELDTLSVESLMGNFSPTSLYEKNLQLSDSDSPRCRRRPLDDPRNHPLDRGAEDSPELGRRSASPTLYRRQKEFDSPFKRSVRSADDLDEEDELDDLFTDESQVNNFFDKLEKELLSLKSEIADMDGTIEKLTERPRDFPRDLGPASQVLKKYRSSRANSVSDRTLSEENVCNNSCTGANCTGGCGTVSASGTVSGGSGGSAVPSLPPYHLHVHVHVHGEEKKLPVDLRLTDEESMSLSSVAESLESPSREPSVSPTREEPGDLTNNNQEIFSTSSQDSRPQPHPRPRPQTSGILNVGEVCDVIAYAEREWRGNTDTAKTILKGYRAIPEQLTYSRLRRIRGDMYCALRATLYQLFTNKLDPSKNAGDLHDVTEILHDRLNHKHQYLRSWSFANRIPVTSPDHVTKIMVDCLQALYNQYNTLSGLNCTERVESYCTAVNESRDLDIKLMEGVKLLMMLNAIRLHEMCTQGKEVPLFVWLMYARDSSPNPRALFRNHIDKVGDQIGLEQVEMFLLADTLGVLLEVVRPSQFGEEDYITYYPSDSQLPKLTLIAEDDRHYNVLVP